MGYFNLKYHMGNPPSGCLHEKETKIIVIGYILFQKYLNSLLKYSFPLLETIEND